MSGIIRASKYSVNRRYFLTKYYTYQVKPLKYLIKTRKIQTKFNKYLTKLHKYQAQQSHQSSHLSN